MDTNKQGHEAEVLTSRQSQRDCVLQPKVGALSAYLGCEGDDVSYPNGVVSLSIVQWMLQPFQGCFYYLHLSQGSSLTRNPGLTGRIPLGFSPKLSVKHTVADPEHMSMAYGASIRVHSCPFVVKLRR